MGALLGNLLFDGVEEFGGEVEMGKKHLSKPV